MDNHVQCPHCHQSLRIKAPCDGGPSWVESAEATPEHLAPKSKDEADARTYIAGMLAMVRDACLLLEARTTAGHFSDTEARQLLQCARTLRELGAPYDWARCRQWEGALDLVKGMQTETDAATYRVVPKFEVGGRVLESGQDTVDGKTVRAVKRFQLSEVSLVLKGVDVRPVPS